MTPSERTAVLWSSVGSAGLGDRQALSREGVGSGAAEAVDEEAAAAAEAATVMAEAVAVTGGGGGGGGGEEVRRPGERGTHQSGGGARATRSEGVRTEGSE